jgi:hypothetical protein
MRRGVAGDRTSQSRLPNSGESANILPTSRSNSSRDRWNGSVQSVSIAAGHGRYSGIQRYVKRRAKTARLSLQIPHHGFDSRPRLSRQTAPELGKRRWVRFVLGRRQAMCQQPWIGLLEPCAQGRAACMAEGAGAHQRRPGYPTSASGPRWRGRGSTVLRREVRHRRVGFSGRSSSTH